MKQRYSFLVYGKRAPRKFSGIIGGIELHTVHLLLVGGKYILEEQYTGKNPIEWYTDILGQQGIIILQGKQQNWKGQKIIWLEVDLDKTPIHEFTSWKDIESNDTESLVWKTFQYPCQEGSTKECLGFAICARDIPLQSSSTPIMLDTVLDAILLSDLKE